jgi:hypothetical protein
MGIEEVLTAPRSPWQNAFVERVIGSIRWDFLDHVVVLNDRHLKRILTSYFNYYHCWRTHLSLGMDSPESRVAIGAAASTRKGGTISRGRWFTSSLRTVGGLIECDMSFREAQLVFRKAARTLPD